MNLLAICCTGSENNIILLLLLIEPQTQQCIYHWTEVEEAGELIVTFSSGLKSSLSTAAAAAANPK